MKYCLILLALMAAPVFAQDNEEPRKIGPEVTSPVPVERSEPAYTDEAREARLEGSVLLSVVITSEGKTKNIKVVRGLGLGLDEKAVEALGRWKFEPARLRKDNTPVPVSANVEINFRLI